MNRKITISIVFCITNLLFMSIVFFIFYKIYISKLNIKTPSDKNYTGLSGNDFYKLRNRVFKIDTWKKSHFKNFPKKKKGGVIRIGCFGDSFTYGDEVNDILDYPSQLQNIFKENGKSNVEVINFGMSWHGFFQQYLIWDIVGKYYDLDHILLGPTAFRHNRDSTFNHTFSSNYIDGIPSYIHSRYILVDDEARLLDIPGSNIGEKIEDYWGFIPRIRYIRYDTEIPVFLRSIISILRPEKKIIMNPLYYHRDDYKSELNTIYSILLDNMSKNVESVVVGFYKHKFGHVNEILDKTTGNNIKGYELVTTGDFPYIGIGGHNTPAGNRLLAEQYYNYLNSIEVKNLEKLKIKSIDLSEDIKNTETYITNLIEVQDYKSINIEVADKDIARFYDRTVHWTEQCIRSECKYNNNIFRGVSSLVAILNTNLLDSVYIPLKATKIKNSQVLYLVIAKNGENIRKELEKIKILDNKVQIGYLDFGDYSYDKIQIYPAWKTSIKFKELYDYNELDLENIESLFIELNGESILYSKSLSDIKSQKFYPYNRGLFTIHLKGNEYLDVSKLNNDELVNLSFLFDSKTFRIPIAKLHKSNIYSQ